MANLTTLQSIGKEIERKLVSVGISTAEELKKAGSEDAYFRLKTQYPNVCLTHLYVLEGAISDVEYNQLSDDVKLRLKAIDDKFK